MASTRLSRFSAVLASVCMAAASAFIVTADATRTLIVGLHQFAVEAFDLAVFKAKVFLDNFTETVVQRPLVAVRKARGYAVRIIERRAPRIESNWRMCPSA